jgi:ABC-type antimicrobial peptide transport system permease subunit
VGSLRGQLIGQFLGESIFLALLSFLLSLVPVQAALPWFNSVSDKQMHIFWNSLYFWLPALGLTLLVGLIAGRYPAFYLSSFNPVKVLKGTFKAGRAAALPRQMLIVVQFTVSVTLIIGTIIVFEQVLYVKNRPVGYSREGLITVDILNNDIPNHFAALRQELIQSGLAMEDRIGKLAGFFTILAIFISCLGLFGMASFMAEQRIKEIGVRKVLGASVVNLWGLLSRDFVLLVGLSFLIAMPLAYHVMSGWLLHYDYRVTIPAWVFVVTVVLALAITLATVSYQTIRAAMANPVKSLRTE